MNRIKDQPSKSKRKPLLKGRTHPSDQTKPTLTAVSSSSKELFVIGIGASAGGLEAIRSFLFEFSEKVEVAFVVVQHMAPKYRSMLAELLSRDARISVEEVTDGLKPRPHTLYVTPPNHDILFQNGQLRLVDAPHRIGPKPSIDRFFMSLAEELGENCGGIILSGTGSDGSQGVRAIKAAGGFVIAQNPESAKYDGMPRAAINTGVVDLVLTPQELAQQLGSIVSHLSLPDASESTVYPEEPFNAILELLRRQTKIDFTQYKPNTLKRRLQRRMKACRISSIEKYFELLQKDESEAKRLFQDVLISVTAFFRDKEQYNALRLSLHQYLKDRRNGGPLRIWSAGCSTGEEPYSLAILIHELFRELKFNLDVQIFATDINEDAMTQARRGSYSATSLEDVPPEIVDRYFDRLEGCFQIKKHIRECVVFARHDLTRDPPFLKMDLICCRNVFIYFDQTLQDRIVKIFHYAIKPRGLMFLGKSEAIGPTKSFFSIVDSNARIFQRNERPSDPTISFSSLQLERSENKLKTEWPKTREVGEQLSSLVRSFAPNSIVVDEDFIVREIYGSAKHYLEFPDGSQNLSIERLLNPDIKNKTITLLHRARRSGEIAIGMHFEIKKDETREIVQPRVYPVKINHEPRMILSFESAAAQSNEKRADQSNGKAMVKEMEELERELVATREHLQTVIEEQETANEELQALNEELHSANEELQSTNEELETSNEELQSTNEELTTLNEELNVKTAELLGLNNYLATVQDAIQYPIVVVDRNLNLSRFNHCAEVVLRLHSSHRGKNVRLIPMAENLEPSFDAIEGACKKSEQRILQIRTQNHDYEVKCDPFFNHKNELEGVVVSFIDNTEMFKTLRAVETSEKKLTAIFENITAAVSVKSTSGVYTYVNRHFSERIGLEPKMVLGKTDDHLFDSEMANGMREKDLEVLSGRTSRIAEERVVMAGKRVTLLTSRFPLFGADSIVESVCTVSFDVTAATEARDRLELFKETMAASHQGILVGEMHADGSYITTFVSQSIEELLGIRVLDVIGLPIDKTIERLFGPSSTLDGRSFLQVTLANSHGAIEAKRTMNGEVHSYEIRSTAYHPPGARAPTQVSLIIIDVTERYMNQELLRKKQEEVLKASKLASLGEMAAGIAHELNTPLNTVQSYVDLIRASRRQEGGYEEDTTAQALDKIEATVTRISEIIVGLRSFAKIEKNMIVEELDLAELIHEVLKICDFHIRNKGVNVDVEGADKPILIKGRRTQLSQVLVNLINNSIDAIKNLQEKWVKIKLIEKADTLTIQVIDSGDGIPEKIAAMVMTPFFTTKDEGTGLGLSLSRSIVKDHGGDLRVNSSLRNTCFEVVLPKERKGGADKRLK